MSFNTKQDNRLIVRPIICEPLPTPLPHVNQEHATQMKKVCLQIIMARRDTGCAMAGTLCTEFIFRKIVGNHHTNYYALYEDYYQYMTEWQKRLTYEKYANTLFDHGQPPLPYIFCEQLENDFVIITVDGFSYKYSEKKITLGREKVVV